MVKRTVRITSDRAEGTSSASASGNPSAFSYSVDASYKPIVKLLKARGFSDADTAECGFLLERTTISHLEPYLALVENPLCGTVPTLKSAHDAMTFDRRYQSILFKYIGIIEAQMRAQYSHWMETLHGGYSVYDSTLFLRPKNHSESMTRLAAEVNRKIKKSRSLKRIHSENGGKLPIVFAIECVTLGTLVQLFSNTADRAVTDKVSASFECSKVELSSWMRTVTDVRNICAHFECYAARKQIPSTPLAIKSVLDTDSNSTFYAVLVILNLLSSTPQSFDFNFAYSHRMRVDIRELVHSIEHVYPDMVELLGFPEDWESKMALAAKKPMVRLQHVTES